MWSDERRVSVSLTDLSGYPDDVPFDPPRRYPEATPGGINPSNGVYDHVRGTIQGLGLDREHYGTPAWNPFKDIVRPGMTVLLKPNTVSHEHLAGKNVLSMITHASVIRPLLDYVCIALRGRGRIIIGDAQFMFSLFDEAMTASGLGPLIEWYRCHTTVPIECLDLRMTRAVRTWLGGRWGRRSVEADPRGYRWVDLGSHSRLDELDPRKLRIAVADPAEMRRRHARGRHEYLIPQSVLDSDVVISVPKLKTHRRAGVTLALKGFLGLVAAKEGLPHYTVGSPSEGGDEYVHPSLRKRWHSRLHDLVQSQPLVVQKFLLANLRNAVWATRRIVPFKDEVNEAMWYGNDTIWRTLWDVFHAVMYADREGRVHDLPQRGHFCLIDGIIGGERNGPVAPDPVSAGVLVAGLNPVAVDTVAATLMGFDIRKIPTIRHGVDQYGPEFVSSLQIREAGRAVTLDGLAGCHTRRFEPHPEWVGHVELTSHRGVSTRYRAS